MTYSDRRLIIVLCILPAIALGLMVAIVSTETGSSWIVSRLAPAISENLTVETVRGSLISGLTLNKVNLNTAQLKTSIDQVTFRCRLRSLLLGRLHITKMRMKNTRIYAVGSPAPDPKDIAELPKMIAMPITTVLKRLRMEAVEIHVDDKKYALTEIRLSARADKKGIRIDNLKVCTTEGIMSLKGDAGLRFPYPFKANVHWRWTAAATKPVQGSLSIEGTVEGATSAVRIDLPFALETRAELKPNKDWTKLHIIGIPGDDRPSRPSTETTKADGVTLSQLTCQTLGGSVTLDGRLHWYPEPWMRLFIHGEEINPEVLLPNWPGNLGFRSGLTARIDNDTIIVDIDDLRVLGRLLDQPFESTGKLSLRDRLPKKVNLDIRAGNNRLKLSGNSEDPMKLEFELEILEPESLWPATKGQWRGIGTVGLWKENRAGTMVLYGKNVAYGNFSAETYQGHFTYDDIAPEKCKALIDITNLRVDDERFPHLKIHWSGDLDHHQVSADVVSSTAKMNLGLEGQCLSDTWQFHFHKASMDLNDLGIWKLKQRPIKVQVSQTGIKPFNACWTRKDENLCLEGAWTPDEGWRVAGDLEALPLTRSLDMLKILVQRPKTDKGLYRSGDITYNK